MRKSFWTGHTMQHCMQHRRHGYQVMQTRKSDWLKAFVTSRQCVQRCRRQTNSAIVAWNVAEVELASTPATLRATLHATIAKVDKMEFSHCAQYRSMLHATGKSNLAYTMEDCSLGHSAGLRVRLLLQPVVCMSSLIVQWSTGSFHLNLATAHDSLK